MRRLASGLALAGAVAAGILFAGAGGDERGYRVDAIFDDTAGLIPGQDVKIAGARVGSVADVRLTRDRKARVQMEIDTGFAPLRSDAACIIRPQSLIGEKFVQCDPGSPDGRPLVARGGDAPTVPLKNNSSPVDLDLVFAALRRPYEERLAILINELGTGLAGRPADLDAAIRRANPALKEANDLLAILDTDRRTLARLVDRSDTVLAELAAKDRQAASFIQRADSAASAAATRSGDLEQAVARLPRMLAELEPAAQSLAQLAREGTPVVRDLRAAAPAARDLVGDLDPLADAGRPALRRLSEMSRVGRRAVAAANPVAERLRPLAEVLPPVVDTATNLVTSLRETGSVEGLLSFVFYAALANSRFDSVSHVLPSYQIVSPCQQYATEPQPGCSAQFGPGRAAARRAARRERGKRPPTRQTRSGVPLDPKPEARSFSGTQSTLLDYLLAP